MRSRPAARPLVPRGLAAGLAAVTALVGSAVVVLGVVGARTRRPVATALPGDPRLVGVLGGSARRDDTTRDAPQGEPVHRLRLGRTVVGRHGSCDVVLEEDTVSPRHLVIDVDCDGHAVVHDLGARNGVLLDGRPVARAPLHDGARLTLGEAQLVFRHD